MKLIFPIEPFGSIITSVTSHVVFSFYCKKANDPFLLGPFAFYILLLFYSSTVSTVTSVDFGGVTRLMKKARINATIAIKVDIKNVNWMPSNIA